MFSSRVPGELRINRLSSAVAAARASGRTLLDLTATNPTAVGIEYPSGLLDPLAAEPGNLYRPDALGLPSARAAVAADYRRRGISVAADRVVLTASTSEAYSILFKLLCGPAGDNVLVPAPSYPLFDHLTALDGVEARHYALEYHGRWELDDASVEEAWTSRTRAVLAVSPNNPTGSLLSRAERAALARRCRERDAALIVDEVFADYLLPEGTRASAPGTQVVAARASVPPPERADALTFRLGGLSKSAGLPQVKLGWIAIDGHDEQVAAALSRLELICDTYLSVSTPVQVAAPALIEQGAIVRCRIQQRIAANLARLRQAAAADSSVELLPVEGGWSAVLRVPSRCSEEDLVVSLVEAHDTLVHPGYFFDFPREAFLVFSLLPAEGIFAEGVRRVQEQLHAS